MKKATGKPADYFRRDGREGKGGGRGERRGVGGRAGYGTELSSIEPVKGKRSPVWLRFLATVYFLFSLLLIPF